MFKYQYGGNNFPKYPATGIHVSNLKNTGQSKMLPKSKTGIAP